MKTALEAFYAMKEYLADEQEWGFVFQYPAGHWGWTRNTADIGHYPKCLVTALNVFDYREVQS